jgi:hypothetical protein
MVMGRGQAQWGMFRMAVVRNKERGKDSDQGPCEKVAELRTQLRSEDTGCLELRP